MTKMMAKKRPFAITLAVLMVCAVAWALDDTPASRGKQAERYLVAMPVKEMMSDMAVQVSKNLPAEQQQAFKDLLTKHLDMVALEKAMKKSLVKHFTADELKALADFYSSPVGKSAMKKFGAYMADVMPAIQAEMMKAQAKANRPEGEGESKPDVPPSPDSKTDEAKPNK
jgi:hypothetical protein